MTNNTNDADGGETILRVLDLNTCHVPDSDEKDPTERLDYNGIVSHEIEYGWLVWIPEDIDEHFDGYEDPPPPELINVFRHASALNCTYILFDRDAAVNPNLPTWEW